MDEEQLVQLLAARAKLDEAAAKAVLGALAALARDQLLDERQFAIPGIAQLLLESRPARPARDPRTGRAVTVPERAVVRARVDETLRHAVEERARTAASPPVPSLAEPPRWESDGAPVRDATLSPEDWTALVGAPDIRRRNELVKRVAARLDPSELPILVERCAADDEAERDVANRLLLSVFRARGRELSVELLSRWTRRLEESVAASYPAPLLFQALYEVAPQSARERLLSVEPAHLSDAGRDRLARDLALVGKSEGSVARLREIVARGGAAAETARRVLEGFLGIDEQTLSELSARWKRERSGETLGAISSRYIDNRLSHPIDRQRVLEILGEPTDDLGWQLIYIPVKEDGHLSEGTSLSLIFDSEERLTEWHMT